MKKQYAAPIKWSENVIIADADYIDKVAFNLIVNFERMIMRRIPPADMARWIDCVALDGGLREGANDTQVVLVYTKKKTAMENFQPSNFDKELNGKAFKDNLGEFTILGLPVEDIVKADDLFLDITEIICNAEEVKRIMIIPNAEDDNLYNNIRRMLQRDSNSDNKRITVFTMEPRQGGNFRQEILGYSLMNALGIRSDEIIV